MKKIILCILIIVGLKYLYNNNYFDSFIDWYDSGKESIQQSIEVRRSNNSRTPK